MLKPIRIRVRPSGDVKKRLQEECELLAFEVLNWLCKGEQKVRFLQPSLMYPSDSVLYVRKRPGNTS